MGSRSNNVALGFILVNIGVLLLLVVKSGVIEEYVGTIDSINCFQSSTLIVPFQHTSTSLFESGRIITKYTYKISDSVTFIEPGNNGPSLSLSRPQPRSPGALRR
jgi:hypothetical protein